MPRSFANYLSYINGEPFLGRLKVLNPQPVGQQYAAVPLMQCDQFGQFINGSVESRTEGIIRNQFALSVGPPVSQGIHICSNFVADDSGSNGRFINFWQWFFSPQTDSFGYSRPSFVRDMAGAAHGPGTLPHNGSVAILGWGTPTTS